VSTSTYASTGTSASTGTVWRDLTDPRRAAEVDDLEAGLKEPAFANLDIPETLGPVQVLIDDHKIKRFAFTQDDYSPFSLEAGPCADGTRVGQAALLGNDLVQLFTTVYAASRVVGLHTEEQLWFDSPARLGEVVTLAGTYVEAYERRGEGYVVMEAQATGEDGRSIVRHRGVEILQTVPGPIAGRGSSGTPSRRVTGEVPDGAQEISTLDGGTRVGDVLAPLTKTFTFEQAAVFSRLGEYVSNIHNSLAEAHAGGLRVPIVQGQQQFGALAGLLTRAFGPTFFTTGWLRLKFLVPLEVFEPVVLTGLVTAVGPGEDGATRIELDVWGRSARTGRLMTVGWAAGSLPTAS